MTPHQELTATLATTPVLKASFIGVTGPQGPPGPEGPAGPPGPSGSQTPWSTDVDAAGHSLTNAGKVGIGNASPYFPLDVVRATRIVPGNDDGQITGGQMRILGGGGPDNILLECWNGAGSGPANGLYVVGDGAHQLLAFAIEADRIALNGPVGVGTGAPGYPLDVVGDINCTGQFRISGTPHMMLTQEQYDALVARIAALEAKP